MSTTAHTDTKDHTKHSGIFSELRILAMMRSHNWGTHDLHVRQPEDTTSHSSQRAGTPARGLKLRDVKWDYMPTGYRLDHTLWGNLPRY